MNKGLVARLEKLEARKKDVYVPPPVAPFKRVLGGLFRRPVPSAPVACYELRPRLGLRVRDRLPQLDARATGRPPHAKAVERICRRRRIDPISLEPRDKFERMLKQISKSGLPIPAESWAA